MRPETGMSSMKRPTRALRWCAGVLVAISATAGLSFVTTTYHIDGIVSPGHWRCRVVTPEGMPVARARMDVVSRSGPVYPLPFKNAGWDGSLTADAGGVVELIIPGDVQAGFGGSGWRLFWVFDIYHDSSPYADDLCFSADGYDSVYVPFERVSTSGDTIVVTLSPKGTGHTRRP